MVLIGTFIKLFKFVFFVHKDESVTLKLIFANFDANAMFKDSIPPNLPNLSDLRLNFKGQLIKIFILILCYNNMLSLL
jgi:hypothetical protein